MKKIGLEMRLANGRYWCDIDQLINFFSEGFNKEETEAYQFVAKVLKHTKEITLDKAKVMRASEWDGKQTPLGSAE